MARDNEKKPIIEWDTYEIGTDEVKRIKEEKDEDADLPEDKLRDKVFGDSQFFGREWEWRTGYLSEKMKEKNPGCRWHVEGRGLGWKRRSGEADIKTCDGEELLGKILPQKTENKFKIFETEDGFSVNNAHHDAPGGDEWYFVSKATEEPEDEESGEGED